SADRDPRQLRYWTGLLGPGALDVLGQHAHADYSRYDLLDPRYADRSPELPGRNGRAGIAEDCLQRLVCVNLDELRYASWKFTPVLDSRQHRLRHSTLTQRVRQQVRGRDSILDGKIDTDASHRRHGVRRIANAQESRAIPLPQPVDLHRQ